MSAPPPSPPTLFAMSAVTFIAWGQTSTCSISAFSCKEAHFIRLVRNNLLAAVGPGDKTNLNPWLEPCTHISNWLQDSRSSMWNQQLYLETEHLKDINQTKETNTMRSNSSWIPNYLLNKPRILWNVICTPLVNTVMNQRCTNTSMRKSLKLRYHDLQRPRNYYGTKAYQSSSATSTSFSHHPRGDFCNLPPIHIISSK